MTSSIDGKASLRKALIVGISDYTNLQKLDFCKNDGTGVREVLSKLGYEISEKNKLVGEADGEKLRDAIYNFFGDTSTNPDDTLFFYYSIQSFPVSQIKELNVISRSQEDSFLKVFIVNRSYVPSNITTYYLVFVMLFKKTTLSSSC